MTSFAQYTNILALIYRDVITNSPYTIFEQVDLLTARIYLQNLSCNFSKMQHFPSPHTSDEYNITGFTRWVNSLTATSTGKENLLIF